MKRFFKVFALISLSLVILFTAISCAKGYGRSDANAQGLVGGGAASKDHYGTLGDKYENGNVTSSKIVFENRKIIKNVNETVQTEDFDAFISSLYAAIDEVGGYVFSREESNGGYYNQGRARSSSLVIKIPSESLDSFTEGLSGLGSVVSYRESVEDVTEAYIDVESRIAVLEAEESALLTILSSAATTGDALAVRDSLLSVQSELASLRAQKRSYDSRIDFSTVNLYVSEVRREEKTNPTFFEEVGTNFSDSLYNLGQDFRGIGVFLLGDSPYILISVIVLGGIATAGFFVGRRLWRKFRKS